jgi:hypothetical protein
MNAEPDLDLSQVGMLSAKESLILFFTLPAVQAEEIEGMVRLQAEQISPYPIEKTCVAWEAVWQDATHSRVLVTVCEASRLEPFRSSPQQEISRIDVDIPAYWEAIKISAEPEDCGNGFHLILLEEDLYLTAADEKGLCMIWPLPHAAEMSPAELEEELASAAISLVATAPELDTRQVTLWHRDPLPAWAAPFEQTGTGRDVRLKPLPDPEAGIAARTMSGDKLDLMPRAWTREKEQRSQRRKLLQLAAVLLGIWVLGMGFFLGRNVLLSQRLRDLREANTSPAIEKVRTLEEQLVSLQPFTDRRTSALNSLLVLAEALPGNGTLIINRFRYSKGSGISLGGSMEGSSEVFNRFLGNLSNQEDVEVLQYDLKTASRGSTFQIDLEWQPLEPLPEDSP